MPQSPVRQAVAARLAFAPPRGNRMISHHLRPHFMTDFSMAHRMGWLLLLACCAPAFFPEVARAQNVNWNGANANWNVPGDWSGGKVPGSGTTAIINSGTVSLPLGVTGNPSAVYVGDTGGGGFMVNGGTLNATTVVMGVAAHSSGTFTMTRGSL